MIGTWEGSLDVGGTQLRIVFHVERGDDGSLGGTMDSPDQGGFGIGLSGVTVEGSDVTFGVAAVGGEYTGTLSETGDEIGGTWSQGPNNLPLKPMRSEGAAAPKMKSFMEREVAALSEETRASAGAGLSEESISRTIAQLNSPWFRFFLHHDPRPALERLDVPVLSLIGEKDLQVPHALNNPEIEAAFGRGGNPDATVRTLPGLNHLFQEAETGSPAEYQRIEETMNAVALEAVSEWILERFGPGID